MGTGQRAHGRLPLVRLAACALSGLVLGAIITLQILRSIHAGCQPQDTGTGWSCQDGLAYAIPVLTGAEVGGLLLFGVAVLVTAGGAGAGELRRLGRAVLLTIAVTVGTVAVAFTGLAFADGPSRGLPGVAFIILIAIPPLVEYHFQAALPTVLLMFSSVAVFVQVIFWQQLLLALPATIALTASWLLTFSLTVRSATLENRG